MAKTATVNLSADVVKHFNEAAQKLLQRRGIFAKPGSPEDVRKELCKGLKKMETIRIGEADVVKEGKTPRFVFHDTGEIAIMGPEGGQRTYLFIGAEGAGVVEYGIYARPVFFFYSDANGSQEQEDGKFIRTANGKREEFKVAPVDYTKTLSQVGGQIDEAWLNAVSVLEARVEELERDTMSAISWAGMRRK